MSRTGLHRPRRTRAASPRPAPDTRLLFTLFPPHILHLNTHNKRCPKALRLDLRSDQSPPRPSNGRFPDKSRQALLEGNCQVSAPLIGRNGFAPSGDAPEHGVKLLHWAIAPFSDSTVVTIGKFRSTNAGLGSPLPSLRVVEHFRWSRLPQSENLSRLVHILSEVWGCRRVDADVDRPQGRTPRIGTGVADILHKPSGTFHHLPFSILPGPSLSVIPDPDRVEDAPRRESIPGAGAEGRSPTPSPSRGEGWGEGDPLPKVRDCNHQPTPLILSFRCPARSKMSKMRLGVRRAESPPLAERESIPGVGRGRGRPPPPPHAKSPEIPSGVVQSKQLRVQSMFNQRSIKTPPDYNVSASKPPTPP